ncbi:MAG: TonB-dependent receptor [Pseudomonadales bacterium]|jgi:outer membrane receptor protein involved in Fe transport|nr:TonB-dependent receptor [Pseudomonadales bacterium]MDP6470106.1 TonB-dependent receptor [Pseudomonadales bacterium]MDP6827009.1 TonB-dependent receptor [Pseudomonadales bacterium]MDP6972067.1 TonB-dependent receptor [Pseudomonadales bacterium]|tara:strand:- start:5211 stop:8165 length:2955 start_codon:yes stop_codon:yes gene_type:complete
MSIARRILRLSALLPFFAFPFATYAEESEIEEVVVTGSYLKRSTADSPSPLSVVDKADIDELGAFDVKDIVNSLTYNSGNISQSTPFYGGDSSNGNTNINLRNLGNGSTLVLINGKRNTPTNFDNVGNGYVDLSGIVPNIAIERVEIVKDGSSALYGSDAIAGVVNFITRQDFEGAELSIDYSTDDETKLQDDMLIQGIIGISSDRGNVTISASYLSRDPLAIGDRYETYGESGLSTFGQPGRYVALAPVTSTPSFFSPGSTTFGGGADPDCDLAAVDDGPKGVLGTFGPSLCIYDFSSFFQLVAEQEQTKVHATANYALTDNVEIYGEASFSDNQIFRGNSLFPDVSFAVIPNHNLGLQLDAARRGIAAVPYLALQRLLGGHNDSTWADRPVDTESKFDRQFYRLFGGMTIDMDAWTVDVSVGRSERNSAAVTPSDTITSHTDAAYAGLGGVDCDPLNGVPGSGNLGTGNCFYYNPFGTSRFDPVTGARWDTSDASPWAADPSITVAEAAQRYQNSDALYQWIAGEIASDTEFTQTVIDFVFAGDLFETANGAVGLAVGAQWRKDEANVDNDKILNDNNFKFVYGAQDWDGELTTTALFVEVFVPITDRLELTVAGRYEDFDEISTDTLDPKATLMFRPTDSLTLRASAGTSFRVGSLLQLLGQQTTLLNSTDPFSGTGGLAFRPTLTDGNSNLQPEEATTFNIGFSWAPIDGPLEGLSVDVDYYDYEYDKIITREGHQDLINQDNASRCPNGLNADPLAGPLCGVSDQNGDGLNEVYSVGPGLPNKVIRAQDGGLLRTQASYLNAQSLETTGVDATIRYDWDSDDLGLFRATFSGSYTIDYDLVDQQGREIDGVGSTNRTNSVGHSLPEYKLSASLSWTRDRYSAIATVRHIDAYDDDLDQSALRGSYIGFAPEIDDWTTLDLQFTMQLPAFGFQSEGSSFTLGVKNATDEEPPLMNVDGAYDPFQHDPRGRIWYGRYTMAM